MQFVEIYLPDGLSPESYSSYVVKSYLVRIKIMMFAISWNNWKKVRAKIVREEPKLINEELLSPN